MNVNSAIFVPIPPATTKMASSKKRDAKSDAVMLPFGAPTNVGQWHILVNAMPIVHYSYHYQQQQYFQQQRLFFNPNVNQGPLTRQQHQQQQKQQQRKNNTKNTKSGDMMRTQKYVNFSAIKAETEATTSETASAEQLTCEPEVTTSNDDTMQRNSSKAGQHTTKSHHHSHFHHHHHNHLNSKNDSSDSGISTNGQKYQHQHGSKQRKTRSTTKRQEAVASNGATGQNVGQKRATDLSFNDWLDAEMMYCYEQRFMSSCDNDNRKPRQIHRDSTSSETAASEDLNSSSSNEDLSSTYSVMPKTKGKSKPRQKRQQRQKPQRSSQPCRANNNNEFMDIDEESKENCQPNTKPAQMVKNANINLRKHCNKSNMLKSQATNVKGVLSNTHTTHPAGGGKRNGNGLSNSASNSSVSSAISSFSSASASSSSAASSANCSPTASPTASKRHHAPNYRRIAAALAAPVTPPSHLALHMSEEELVEQLHGYVISPHLLRVYGYPVESVIHTGCIEIFKCSPKPFSNSNSKSQQQQQLGTVINANDGLFVSAKTSGGSKISSSSDSGQVSGDASPTAMDAETSEDEPTFTTGFFTPDGAYQIFAEYDSSPEKQCVRCNRAFQVSNAGEYLSRESCVFHWGRLNTTYRPDQGIKYEYSCCAGGKDSEGCVHNKLHVWTGSVVGLNGPYNDFVHTRPRSEPRATKIYALDCEMSFTGRGLDVTKVSVVDYSGRLVYEHFVRPDAPIVDYNTRFSGVSEKDLCPELNSSVKTLAEVQADLLELIDAETILIGHALDNDLRALRIVHKAIVDTSVAFPHSVGFPYKHGLKHLVRVCLGRNIQCSDAGHSSYEDSLACLELMHWRIKQNMLGNADDFVI